MDVALATTRGLAELDQDDAPLLAALRARGLAADLAVWDDPAVDWSAHRLVVIRSTWDYSDRREEYVAWADRVAAVTALWNPPAVVRWNTHKRYLIELEERGAPVVPTAWLARGDRIDLPALLGRRGWSEAVCKPAVGAGSVGLVHVTPGTAELAQHHLDALLRHHDVLVQPVLPAIRDRGELSVVVIDGAYSHAVRKRPRGGEIRIQVEFGGRYTREDAAPETAALAEWVVASTGHDLLYARVDLIEDASGTPQLVELEATEPSLYLDAAPDGADRLATAIARRL